MHATPRHRFRPLWLWSALAAVVALGLAAWVVRLQETACAAQSPPSVGPDDSDVQMKGEAVYYSFGGEVACSFPGLAPDGYYASVPSSDYGQADECGSFLDIEGPGGRVRAEVVDRCPWCGPDQLDLSKAAFQRLADLSRGRIPIVFRQVRDPVPASGLAYEVKQGSSPDWLGLLVSGNGNPIQRVEARPGSGGPWRRLTRGLDNFWTVSGAGSGPFDIDVTDAYGHHAQAHGIELLPGRVQRTATSLYPLPAAQPTAQPSQTPPAAAPSPGQAAGTAPRRAARC